MLQIKNTIPKVAGKLMSPSRRCIHSTMQASPRSSRSIQLALRKSPLLNMYSNCGLRAYSTAQANEPQAASATNATNASGTSPVKVTNPAKGLSGKVLGIDITPSAVEKLHTLMEADKRPDLVLKIHVESGGCHGFQYIFDLKNKDELTPKDSIFERDGAFVAVDHNSLQILRDSSIDYATELIGSQFKIVSPHTSSSCGCGTSFSIEPEQAA